MLYLACDFGNFTLLVEIDKFHSARFVGKNITLVDRLLVGVGRREILGIAFFDVQNVGEITAEEGNARRVYGTQLIDVAKMQNSY